MGQHRTPEEEAELQRLIEDANKPLPMIVDEMAEGDQVGARRVSKTEALRRWANAVIGAFESLNESGLSYDEIEANYDISLKTYRHALQALETGRFPVDEDERKPLDETDWP